jgi:acyl-CoA thioester hydrolase
MARVKIEMPERFSFSTTLPVRITDLNYGGHVGNDSMLSIIHEIRAQFIQHLGYTEMNFGGIGLIMSDVIIEFKQELFYGDLIEAKIAVTEISRIGFDLTYQLSTTSENGNTRIVALSKSGMVCYDYGKKKIVSTPEEVKRILSSI